MIYREVFLGRDVFIERWNTPQNVILRLKELQP